MVSVSNVLPARWSALLRDSGEARPVASYRADLVTVLLGAWFTVGLLLDAWAHNNVPGLETFFTPWHAVFYSGFVATAAWMLWVVLRELRAGRRGLAAVPVGYAAGVAALPLFAVAGVGDYLWHTIFGIEQNVKILFSPTHLALITAMVLIITTPLRAAWANRSLPASPSLGRLLPAVLSLAFSTTLIMLFLQYGNALAYSANGIVRSLSADDGQFTSMLVAAIALTNIVLLAPALVLARRWTLPPGTVTIVFAMAAGLAGAVRGFENLSTVVAALLAGAVVDVLAQWLRPTPARRAAYWSFAALAGLLTWTLYISLATLAADGAPTIVELWSGVPIVQALVGLLLAVLLVPGARHERPDPAAPRLPGAAGPAPVEVSDPSPSAVGASASAAPRPADPASVR